MATIKNFGEFNLIDRIQAISKSVPMPKDVLCGIGDDAAVIRKNKSEVELISTDAIVSGVDFDIKKAKPDLIGRKLMAINLSDIAAMGGVPEQALLTLGVPASTTTTWLEQFIKGFSKLAKEYKVKLVGGDITSSKEFWASVTLRGKAKTNGWVSRSKAKSGDLVFVTGSLGGSLLGSHLEFTPRVKEVKKLMGVIKPSSMIDVSDGLLQDLNHILKASKVGAAIYADWVPVSQDAVKIAKSTKKSPLQHALTDGEDFELLFTVSRAQLKKVPNFLLKTHVTCVGVITKKKELNIFRSPSNLKNVQVSKKGFVHF